MTTTCDRCRAPIGRDWPKVKSGTRTVCWSCAESLGFTACYATDPEHGPYADDLVADAADAGVAVRVALGLVLCVALIGLAWLKAVAS